jgi:HSP20 family protein
MAQSLLPWTPFRDFSRLFDEMGFPTGRTAAPRAGAAWPDGAFAPALDVSETKESYQVRVELPGVDAKDVHVTCTDNYLTIRGEKRTEVEEKEKTFHRIERSYGSFVRTVELPTPVDGTKVNATFAKGVLEVELPKTAEQKTREIQVKVK